MRSIFASMILLIGLVANAQEVKLISVESLDNMIAENGDQVRVYNFWASWCGPCVKEMPYFEEVNSAKQAEVIFVSLDFPEDLEKAQKLISKKGIQSETYLLNSTNYDEYIPKISEAWSGAIPATLFVSPSGKKYFYEKAFEKNELVQVVKSLSSK
ncbi:MAG: thiol-disulfide oxidoreductase [Flammeovirgaceae bacterium]|nr:thiol-disulfide oxidoreductase [Flammeovirgaceae bacterium]MBE60748.1 thiol-disulfide oxidoreductase [Flammeovirgaceae bacterium]MBR09995.1 thiol-disulfide oxidoreductase [Rickettsiales bacterium]